MRHSHVLWTMGALVACSSPPPSQRPAVAPVPPVPASSVAAPAETTPEPVPAPKPELSVQDKFMADIKRDAEEKNLVVDDAPTSAGAAKVPLYGAIVTKGTTWKVTTTTTSDDGPPKKTVDRCRVATVDDAGWALVARVACAKYRAPQMFEPPHPLEGYWIATAKGLFRAAPMDDPAANQPPLVQKHLATRATPAAMTIEGIFIDSAIDGYTIAEEGGAWCRTHESQEGPRFVTTKVCFAEGQGFTRAELVHGMSAAEAPSKTTVTYELTK